MLALGELRLRPSCARSGVLPRRNRPAARRPGPCRRLARWRRARPSRSRRGGGRIRRNRRGSLASRPERGSRSARRCGPSAVSNRPLKKSSAFTVRLPFGPAISTSPPSASRQAGNSAAGSAKAIEPPSVPRLRIAAWPMCGMASAISGACRAMSAERSASAWRVSAPISTVPFLTAMPAEPADAIQVDQKLRRRQPHVERGDQALAAGEQPRLASARQQLDGMIERFRLGIGKWRRLHASPLVFLVGDCVAGGGGRSMRQVGAECATHPCGW